MMRVLACLTVMLSLEAAAFPGAFNPDFGAGTTVFTPFSPPYSSDIRAMAIQPDGRIVVAGTSYIGTTGFFALARYNRDGSLDTSFGPGGKVTTSMPGGSANANALALLPDGKLLVAGQDATCRIARYTSGGVLDTTFGTGGIVTTNLCSSVRGMAVDSSGRIILAGYASFSFVVIRLTSTGATDAAFNGTGLAVVGTGTGSITHTATSVAIAPGGKIVAAGYTFVGGLGLNSATLRVARLNDNGSFDSTFGGTGVVATNVSVQAAPPNGPQDYAYAVAVQPGGEIVITGSASATTGPGHLLVARFTSTGALDTTFNGAGFAVATIGSNSTGYALALQPNGKVVVAGRANIATKDQIAVVRFLANGAPDNLFGTGGVVTLPFAGGAAAEAVTLDTGGGIYVGGYANPFLAGQVFAITALEGDDVGAPQIAFTGTPALVDNSNAGFGFTVTDTGGSGIVAIECRLDAASFASCSSPVALSGLANGSHSFEVRARDGAGNVGTSKRTWTVSALSGAPRLVNISTRGQVQTGFDVMIGGFVLGGVTPKTVVIRAIGPSLANYGVPGALADPTMQIVRIDNNAVVATNDDWGTDPTASVVRDLGLAPLHPKESALYLTLGPGAYTAIVSGVGGASGVGLIEVYEVGMPEVQLINISTRGKVQTGSDVMIGGFVILGDSAMTVLIRAIGPSLANYGVSGALPNPTMQLVRIADNAVMASNDDWANAANVAQIQATGLAPIHPLESAILVTLAPGAYTAIVSGVGGTSGVGLVEVYKVGP